jgi:hypothetical protein
MPRRRKTTPRDANGVRDFRHADARRPNNPPAGIAPTYEVRERQTTRYSYDPHLDPQLVWAGKAEHTSFEVDVVPLHIHERISTRAILEAVKKPEPQLALFGETPLPAHQQIEFYQHEVGWANRLILGDSLLVMNSLLVKEGMAGKVQMIYIDPPYGIKYASNFQPRIDRRDVKGQGRRPHPRAGADQSLPRHLDARHPLLPDLPARPPAFVPGTPQRERLHLRADQRREPAPGALPAGRGVRKGELCGGGGVSDCGEPKHDNNSKVIRLSALVWTRYCATQS